MPSARRNRKGTYSNKARPNDQNLASSPQLSLKSDATSTPESLRERAQAYPEDASSSTSNSVTNDIGKLAIKISHTSPNGAENDLVHSAEESELPGELRTFLDMASDEEVIIFSGRAKRDRPAHKIEDDAGDVMQKIEKEPNPVSQNLSQPAVNTVGVAAGQDLKIKNGSNVSRRKSSQTWAKRHRVSVKDENNAIMADYISNIETTDVMKGTALTGQFQHRDLDLDGWDAVDVQDFDDISSSSEPINEMPRILRRRLRKSEAQYLVVASDQSVDEARWMARNLLTAPSAQEAIEDFEKDLSRINDAAAEDSSSEGNSSPDMVADEYDLEARRKARISDEHIARLLSKQAQLGLMGDDLVLIDDRAIDGISNDIEFAIGAASVSSKRPVSGGGRRNESRVLGLSTSYTQDKALEDDDDLDDMDYQPQKLRRKAKGGFPHQHVLELSDSDLQQSLISAWQSDRTKKKQRKQDRELLRAQGELGKKGKRDVIKSLPRNMKMDQIPREIISFLESSATSCTLPPMSQTERKMIHLIAHKSGLKSRSSGSGAARFPVLFKTSRTKRLTRGLEALINGVFTPQSRLTPLEKSHRKHPPPTRNSFGGNVAAASYHDGEIVGVGAPEVGLDNRGRAMLERMGWSAGNSLGASNNKGITQPIEQIVKTSKAGLG